MDQLWSTFPLRMRLSWLMSITEFSLSAPSGDTSARLHPFRRNCSTSLYLLDSYFRITHSVMVFVSLFLLRRFSIRRLVIVRMPRIILIVRMGMSMLMLVGMHQIAVAMLVCVRVFV